MTIAYTDGSSRGNPGPGGWGVIILSDERVIELGGANTHTTNNKMELTAAIRVLEFIPDSLITIYTDSEYVMKGMTTWVHRWQMKGWKTANRKPVLNKDLWQRLIELAEGRKIEWQYVASHSGVPLNERADEIATSFADGHEPSLYDGPKDKYK